MMRISYILGDTINLTSRMESSGEVGENNISEAIYTLVKDRFSCVFRGNIQAKSKVEIKIYFVERIL
jgi:class 3 adenylate cyclase